MAEYPSFFMNEQDGTHLKIETREMCTVLHQKVIWHYHIAGLFIVSQTHLRHLMCTTINVIDQEGIHN